MTNGVQQEPWHQQRKRLGKDILAQLYENRLLKTWRRDQPEGWELVSGYWSPFYIQLRNLPSYPGTFRSAAQAMAEVVRHECPTANRIIGLAAAGVPLAAAVALELEMPMGYTRKLSGVRTVKDLRMPEENYGAHALVEGDLAEGDRIILVDDVVARFTSKELGIAQVKAEAQRRGLSQINIIGIAVLVDREQGGAESAERFGIQIHAPIRFRSEGLEWLANKIPSRELEVIKDYLADQDRYQDETLQTQLKEEAEAALDASGGK